MAREPEVSIMKITPNQAARWLESNHERNRFMRQRRVIKYTQDMKEGNWVLANQVIVFDTKTKLINGQHTLTAVVESGKTIDCIVLVNAPEKAKMVMDTTAQRSSSEHFRMMGRDYILQADSTAKRILNGKDFAFSGPLGDFELDAFLSKHHDLIAWAHHHFHSGTDVPMHNATFRAVACRAALCDERKERIEQFADVIRTGLMDPGDNAGILLRNYMLLPANAGYNSGTKHRLHFYLLVESALRNFLDKNTEIKRLRPATKELFPLDKDEANEPELTPEELKAVAS